MAAETNLIQLYSKRILELAADIPLIERLENPQGTAKRRSPLCGSTVTVDVALKGERISAYGQDVKACALGQASASILARNVLGKTPADIHAARQALAAMLKENAEAPQGDFAELKVLSPAREYKNRHMSILLAYDALIEALDNARKAESTLP